MNKQKTEFFRKLLNSQLESIRHELELNTLQAKSEDEVYADWTDVASVETDKEMQSKIRNREITQLRKIDDALARLDNGTFGVCLRCDEVILEQRLKARPTTTLCIDCQSELESENHMQKYMM